MKRTLSNISIKSFSSEEGIAIYPNDFDESFETSKKTNIKQIIVPNIKYNFIVKKFSKNQIYNIIVNFFSEKYPESICNYIDFNYMFTIFFPQYYELSNLEIILSEIDDFYNIEVRNIYYNSDENLYNEFKKKFNIN